MAAEYESLHAARYSGPLRFAFVRRGFAESPYTE